MGETAEMSQNLPPLAFSFDDKVLAASDIPATKLELIPRWLLIQNWTPDVLDYDDSKELHVLKDLLGIEVLDSMPYRSTSKQHPLPLEEWRMRPVSVREHRGYWLQTFSFEENTVRWRLNRHMPTSRSTVVFADENNQATYYHLYHMPDDSFAALTQVESLKSNWNDITGADFDGKKAAYEIVKTIVSAYLDDELCIHRPLKFADFVLLHQKDKANIASVQNSWSDRAMNLMSPSVFSKTSDDNAVCLPLAKALWSLIEGDYSTFKLGRTHINGREDTSRVARDFGSALWHFVQVALLGSYRRGQSDAMNWDGVQIYKGTPRRLTDRDFYEFQGVEERWVDMIIPKSADSKPPAVANSSAAMTTTEPKGSKQPYPSSRRPLPSDF